MVDQISSRFPNVSVRWGKRHNDSLRGDTCRNVTINSLFGDDGHEIHSYAAWRRDQKKKREERIDKAYRALICTEEWYELAKSYLELVRICKEITAASRERYYREFNKRPDPVYFDGYLPIVSYFPKFIPPHPPETWVAPSFKEYCVGVGEITII